ncbi:MAG: hypothetical protein H7323_13790 [Frankiales bacterium]|nr:hypothetical protein [Frankiales bacterium]
MSSFLVDPASLLAAAGLADLMAADLDAVAGAMAGLTWPDTGTPVGDAHVAATTRSLAAGIGQCADTARREAVTQRSAAARYLAADRAAGGGPCA